MRDEPVEMADGNHSEEEDSELLKLIGSKYDSHGESLQSDTGTDYSREQSVDGIFNGSWNTTSRIGGGVMILTANLLQFYTGQHSPFTFYHRWCPGCV